MANPSPVPSRRLRGSAACSVLLIGLLCPRLSAEGGPVSPALKALDILGRHCAGCHGEGTPRAGFSVYSRDDLIGKRKLIRPKSPDQSELMELIEAGNMPPGTRPKLTGEEQQVLRNWIASGAPGVSASEYTLHHMLADWKQVKAGGGAASVRYLSLSHLLDADKWSGRLDSTRDDLPRMLASLLPAGRRGPVNLLVPVDPGRTVFRVNLTDLGWDRAPFQKWVRARKKGIQYASIGPSKVNLFDLALLEYPYAILPTSAEFPDDLADFLRSTHQVRPVPYLRGDWLLALLGDADFHAELARLLKQPGASQPPMRGPRGFRDDLIGPEDVAAELGQFVEPLALTKAASKAGLSELAEGKKVSRKDWELRLARLVEHLNLGTAIVPLDGLTWPNYVPDRDPTLTVEAVDPKTGKAASRFKPMGFFAVWVDVKQPTRAELLFRGAFNQISPPMAPFTEPTPEPFHPRWDSRDVLEDGFELPGTKTPTTMHVTVIGFPQESLETAKVPYPASVRLRVPKVARDRILHDLYVLTEDGKRIKPTPSRMLKATVTLTIE